MIPTKQSQLKLMKPFFSYNIIMVSIIFYLANAPFLVGTGYFISTVDRCGIDNVFSPAAAKDAHVCQRPQWPICLY